jgi:uncharacterized SAM-binding protein YcdF (DUF218 family)
VAKRDTEKNTPFWQSWLNRLYQRLTRNDVVGSADLIFVMAGRMERKQYGLELFRTGIAPKLLLSVGRFEVSKMSRLDLEGFQELIALRDRTQPDERHFLVRVDSSGVRIEKVNFQRWNTYGEALGLRQLLQQENARKVMIISTEIHLRRTAFTFSKVFHDLPVKFLYCAVPPRLDSLVRDGWWSRPDDRWYVLSELMKLAGYRVILSMPDWAVRRIMRLRD